MKRSDAGFALPEPFNGGSAIALRPVSALARVLSGFRKYGKIFRISLTERLTYRGDFFLSTVLRFLPVLTTILLWEAIYAGSGKDDLSGFNRKQMIAYLLLIHISRMFSSMPGLAAGISRDIRDGTLKKYLLQPIDLLGYLISYRAAHKTAYIATSALPYALLFIVAQVCGSYFETFPDPLTLIAYLISLVFAFLIGFFFEATIGMIGFWFLEVTSLLYIVMTVNFVVSGQMFPIDLLPPPWGAILKSLPFQYMAYFPATVFLGKTTGSNLAYGLMVEFAWIVFFIVLARWLYRLGLRRYSAFGG
jgi:ABC-2 type transport system permease protein